MARVHLCECHYFFCSRLWRSFSCYTCNKDGFIGRGVLWSDNDKLFLGDSFEKGHSVMINVMVEQNERSVILAPAQAAIKNPRK